MDAMDHSHTRHSSADDDESDSSSDSVTCSTHLDDYLPQPNALQFQFMDLVRAGNVGKLVEFVKKREVGIYTCYLKKVYTCALRYAHNIVCMRAGG